MSVADDDPPLVGVMELEENDTDAPLGAPDTFRDTAELNDPSEFTVTEAVPDPPTLMLRGEMEANEKSFTVSVKFCERFEPTPLPAVS
ncbi:MAG TPA: hypothetical protein VNJ52_09380 [Patescibacteria group bacterium]|nr:hypothetical protein [Patescibacteria group bacterium]